MAACRAVTYSEFIYWAPRVVLACAALVFPTLFFITAGYGRHNHSKTLSIPPKLGWVVMESPSVFLFAWAWVTNPGFGSPLVTVLGVVWLTHYVQRTFVFPLLMRGQGKPMVWYVPLMAVTFNVLNAVPNGAALTERPFDLRVVVGLLLFGVGYGINLHSDHVLRTLRKPGESGYKIPHGGLYRWISAPNYFGELIEWTGFAIAAGTLPAWAFVIFTSANLVPRAWSNHQWYRKTFSDYPQERKAFLPYVW